MAFPATIDPNNLTAGAEVLGLAGSGVGISALLNNVQTSIVNIETKVGVDSSAVTTTLDYLLKNAASINPGHLHTTAGISGQIAVAQGGTGAGTLTGVLIGNGTSAFTTVTAPAGTIVGATDTQTLSNKRTTKRTVIVTQAAIPTINTDNTDVAYITGLAQAITSMTTNLSGTPNANDGLIISITDNGTARAITWGASFESSGNATLPTTTVISTRLDVGFLWNVATNKWRCVAIA